MLELLDHRLDLAVDEVPDERDHGPLVLVQLIHARLHARNRRSTPGTFSQVHSVMYAGRKVEEASVNELFAHPRHPYTCGLLGSMPHLGDSVHSVERKRLVEIPGMVHTVAMCCTSLSCNPVSSTNSRRTAWSVKLPNPA